MNKELFAMKRAKQIYRSTRNQMGEGQKMPPLKEWIREHYRKFSDGFQLSAKLEKILLSR